MSVHFINYNGQIVPADEPILTSENRAFRYGDGVFETMLWQDGTIRYIHLHVARLQESLRMLSIEDDQQYDSYFLKSKVEELIRKNNFIGQQVRVRLIVYRDGGGLYSPEVNRSAYVLQVNRMPDSIRDKKLGLIVDLYTTYKKPYSDLSKLKSINSQIYVLAGLYKKHHAFDEVLILNQQGYLCEGLSSNVFVYYEKTLYTPALSEACVAGVMRSVVMDMAADEGIPVVEAQISPEIMKRADEIFCTNSIQGVQWVMGFKQKRYFNKISRILQEKLINWKYEE